MAKAAVKTTAKKAKTAKTTAVKTATRKATSRTTKRKRSYKELRGWIRILIKEHLMLGAKEIVVTLYEYDTWAGRARKMIIKSLKGEDIIRSGTDKSMLSTDGYFVTDYIPTLPQDPIGMVERVARKMKLKVSKSKNQIIIKK
jgi:hypothetical protein